jgi:hypothetical protein
MKILRLTLLLVVLPIAIIAACSSQIWARQSRLSAGVVVVSEGAEIASFLQRPGEGYVQAYLRFGPGLADDVIMVIDQELIEGVNNPLYVKGGDWMALVGVQRSGAVWMAAGTNEQLKGKPSSDRNWKIQDLKARLQPDAWYRVRVEADFGKRRFKSFTIEGPGINRTLDLSEYLLDYPNYAPFSARTMTYYVGAMRGRGMMKQEGTPIVYFDDVEGGITRPDGTRHRVFFSDFESRQAVGAQPVTAPVIDLRGYKQGHWYLERDESLFRIEQVPFARSGSSVGVADVNLN